MNEFKEFGLVIFDLDDTLVENREATLIARNAAISLLFSQYSNEQRLELLEKWQRLTWFFSSEEQKTELKILVKESGSKITSKRIKEAELTFREIYFSNIKPVNGTFELLDKLLEMGIKIGLVTNGKIKFQRAKLEKTNLSKYFHFNNVIIAPEGSKKAKPHPYSVSKMCYKLNVKSNETLLIGDRTSDVVAANLANCQSVFFYRKNLDVKSPTPMGNLLDIEVPKFSISSLVEVLGIVHESKSKAHLRVGSQ